jgi:hypothetical protein
VGERGVFAKLLAPKWLTNGVLIGVVRGGGHLVIPNRSVRRLLTKFSYSTMRNDRLLKFLGTDDFGFG